VCSCRVLWQAIIEGRASFLARWTLGPLLTTLSYLYNWGHQFRLQTYRRNWITVRRLPCYVISIGNLTLGGTGKTPLVESIVSLLQRDHLRVGVLSGGYGGRKFPSPTIVSDGKQCLLPPEIAGDEPVLLAEHLAGVPVILGKDRYAAGMLAVEHFGVDVIVLDDGFQHVQLARDLDILLLDAMRPFGNGRLFPRGDLREPPAAMARAGVVVLTHWQADTAPSLTTLGPLLPTIPLFRSQHEVLDLRALADGQILPYTSLKGQRIVAFCGIGMPDQFRQTLQRLEADIMAFVAFPDHHPYTQPEIEQLVLMLRHHNAEILVTTEKDGIRLRGLRPLRGQLWELRIRATIVEPEAAWKSCLLNMILGQKCSPRSPSSGPW